MSRERRPRELGLILWPQECFEPRSLCVWAGMLHQGGHGVLILLPGQVGWRSQGMGPALGGCFSSRCNANDCRRAGALLPST